MIPATMNTAVLTAFGGPDVVRIAKRPIPALKPDEILIRNRAATVNSGDARIRAKNVPKGYGFLMSMMFGFSKPKITALGTVFAGEVVSVGDLVTDFKPGDRVFGSTEMKMGTHAEIVILKASAAVVTLPDDLSFEDAASYVFGTGTALHFLEKSKLQQGESILINGAAGSVGIAMLQLAHARGAHVTAIASAGNHAFLREQGADEVIDYHTTDLTTLSQKYDVIADCPGTMPYAKHRHLLEKGGRFAMVTGTMAEALATPLVNAMRSHRIVGGTSMATKESLKIILRLHETGKVSPVIDKRFAFAQIAHAHAHVDTGHKRGNTVLTF